MRLASSKLCCTVLVPTSELLADEEICRCSGNVLGALVAPMLCCCLFAHVTSRVRSKWHELWDCQSHVFHHLSPQRSRGAGHFWVNPEYPRIHGPSAHGSNLECLDWDGLGAAPVSDPQDHDMLCVLCEFCAKQGTVRTTEAVRPAPLDLPAQRLAMALAGSASLLGHHWHSGQPAENKQGHILSRIQGWDIGP